MKNEIQLQSVFHNTANLQLSTISLKDEYRKQWNIYEHDFICLTREGALVRDTIYRIGGMGTPNLETDDYFMLLKHVEAFYDDSITKEKARKPHLESRWCILDKFGNEKVEFKQFASPYLRKNSQIYSLDNKYYNIESGEYYGYAYSSMESNEYIFIDNSLVDDKTQRGVKKINKKNGTWELFK